jgi:hypothetical protein
MKRDVGMFLLAACLTPWGSQAWATDYQKLADRQPWQWDGEQASLLYSVDSQMGNFRAEILCPKRDTYPSPLNRLTVRFLDDDGKEVYSFQAHRGTVFTWDGKVLYVAEFHPRMPGCSVAAYDITEKKQLWKTRLQSRYKGFHSAYTNAVTIENDREALLIRGNEAMYRYIEYLDMKTGKTIAQREYPLDR